MVRLLVRMIGVGACGAGIWLVWLSFHPDRLMAMWQTKPLIVAAFGVAIIVGGVIQVVFPLKRNWGINPAMRSFRLGFEPIPDANRASAAITILFFVVALAVIGIVIAAFSCGAGEGPSR